MNRLKNSGEYQKCCDRIKHLERTIDGSIYNLDDVNELGRLYKQKGSYEKKYHLPTPNYYQSVDLLNAFSRKQIKEAMNIALDTRKFEIELYWKRANYFWAFMVAVYAAYFILIGYGKGSWIIHSIVCLIGVCFSFGWYLANRGSKYWQENWENHIAVLSKQTTGEIFKHWLRPNDHFINLKGNYPISVSKVNQFLSMITCFSWIILYVISIFKWSVLRPIKEIIIGWLDNIYNLWNATFFSIVSLILLLGILVTVLLWMFKFSRNKSAEYMKEHLKAEHKRHTFIKYN